MPPAVEQQQPLAAVPPARDRDRRRSLISPPPAPAAGGGGHRRGEGGASSPETSRLPPLHQALDDADDTCVVVVSRSETGSSMAPQHPKQQHPNKQQQQQQLAQAALQPLLPWFALLSLSYMGPWTTMGALVSYFKTRHSPEFVVLLNCAYYLPGLPVALLQQYGDEALDARLGSATAYLGRVLLAMLVVVNVLLALPVVSADAEGLVLALTAALGAASWLAHGTATTLAAMFPPRALAWLQTGFRLPELYALAMVSVLDVGAHPDPAHLRLFFHLTAALAAVGLAAWVWLVRHPATRELLRLKDRGGGGWGAEAAAAAAASAAAARAHTQREDVPLLLPASASPLSSSSAPSSSPLTDAERHFVDETIKPCREALFVTIASSVFLSSFLAYARSPANVHRSYCICEALYFIRLFSDLVGRPLATFLPRPRSLRSPSALLHAAVARLALAVLFFCYIGLPGFPQSDAFVGGLVAAFSLLSGYIVVLAYGDAAALVDYSKAFQCHAGASMNLTFQAAAFAAVLLGVVFVDLGCVPRNLS